MTRDDLRSPTVRAPAGSRAPLPALQPVHALFLDFDGTLVEFENNPDLVRADARLRATLAATHAALRGALALVTGRAIADLDRRFAPMRYAVAGVHGLERRSADGRLFRSAARPELRQAAVHLKECFAHDSRILIEDKGEAVAIHFRNARDAGKAIWPVAEAALRALGPGYRLLPGAAVVELVPSGASKGSAVRAYMTEPPFAGRIPVFVGDDVTDLDGFAAVRELGGFAVAVGDRVAAEHRLDGVEAVLQWLRVAVQERR